MGEAFYDPEELRKLIKDVKIQVIALEKEQSALEEENGRLEDKVGGLQREFNILSAMAEAQTLEEDVEGGGESGGGGGGTAAEQKRWAEADRKLEVQILNAEIRGVLSKLEADALQAESNIHSLGKQASVVTAGGDASSGKAVATSMFQKSLEELEADMGETVEARVKLRALMALDADAKRKEKTALIGQIAATRDQLYSLLDERESLREASKNVSLNLNSEDARIRMLLDKHAQIRALIEPFHDGRGWQTAAFFYATGGARDAEISAEDLPRVLRPWIPSPDADLSPEAIDSVLRTIHGAKLGAVGLSVFIELASRLAAAAAADGDSTAAALEAKWE